MDELLVVAATEPELLGAPGARTLVCGIGPVEAAAATAHELAGVPARAVLNVGLAGGRQESGLPVSALVIGAEAVYSDAAGVLVPARVSADAELLRRARAALPGAHVLAIGTSARVGGTAETDVEAMEGFAVLRAAQRAGVPALEVRVVSNEIEERDRARWSFDSALATLAAVLPTLLDALRAP